MHHRGEYRIRGQKKTEDDFDAEIEEQLRLSTHAKGQRRQNSAVLSRKHQESSQNSRLVQSRANSRIGSSVIGSRVGRVLRNSRTDKNGVVDIQFNNVRWISIVSAYDSKRLKNVTVSKQSCESFLKRYGTGIKNDAAAMALLKDIKRHFHSWLGRINEAFSEVIDDFLRVSERAPLQNFKKMEPILESISKDTNMMGEKLEGCLKIYENNDFRKLFSRFLNFNQFSNKLEDLIKGIYESKHRIDELFADLENTEDEHGVDKKVDKIIKKGVREAEHIIEEVNGYNTSIRDRIISKVRLAINDMAEKSLSLFHKVQGAKDLIRRLHKLITDSRRTLESSEIRKISKIFKAVIEQASKFEDFVANFNTEEDHISPKLREKLNQYSESIQEEKRAVCEIQILFIQTVINEAIQTLKSNFILNNALSPLQHKIQYNQFNHTLQEIADAMLDQTSRGSVEGLIKHGKSNFSKLDDELEKIKRALRKNEGIIFVDTENGEIEIMEYCSLVDKYKTKIRNLISKHEESLRNLGIYYRQARLADNQRDPELIYLKDLKKIVQAVNSKQRIDQFQKLKGLSELSANGSIVAAGGQATEVYNLMYEMNQNKKQVFTYNQSNPIKNLIKNIRFDNNLYVQSAFVLESYDIINKTNEKNLIQNLTRLTENNTKRQQQLQDIDGYKTTKPYSHLLDRLYCLCLTKGLKKVVIKELDDNKTIVFPEKEYDAKQMETELKYRGLIGQTIGEGGSFCKNKIKTTVKVMKDMISSFKIIEKLDKNENGQYIILVEALSSFVSQFFRIIISGQDLNERGIQCKKIAIQCIKSLKGKLSNIDLIDQQIDMETADAALKARNKVLKIQSLNHKALAEIEEVSRKNDYLEMFSGFVFTLTEYVRQSKQIAYIALNEFKQPIWLNTVDHSKNGVVAEIDLKGYRRGSFIDDYVRQPPIAKIAEKIEKSKSSPNKGSNTKEAKSFIVRQKSHQKQGMDEQMEIESDNGMQENIESFVQEDNIEEIHDDMVEQINDDVEEDMKEQIQQIQYEEVEDKMDEDIIQEGIQQINVPKKINQKKQTSKKQVLQPQRPKQQEKNASDISVYEVIPHFKQLEQIRSLFLLIESTEVSFWSSQVDYQEVEDYYHRPEDLKDRNNFVKSLQSCLSMFINSRFQQGLSEQIKKLERFITLKQKFNHFGDKNWKVLFEVLSSIDFSYSLLFGGKNQKDEIIQIKIAGRSISNFKKEGARLLLQNFLARTFKSSFFKLDKFNLQDYLSYCFKVEIQQCLNSSGDGFQYIIKVTPQYKQALPEGETHNLLLSLEKIQETFCSNLVTGIDFRAILIQIWVKSVCSDAEDYYKPDYSILNKYTKTLETIEKKEWIGHYLTEFRQSVLKIRDKIKAHKNLIDNTLFKIDNTNIWQCLKSICQLYQKKISKKTVFVTSNSQEHVVYALCEDSAIGITSQSHLSTFLEDLFNRSDSKQQKTIITQEEIVSYIEKEYKKDQNVFELHSSITTLLNILEIQHFYIQQPQIIIKNNLDELVFTVLKSLNVKSKTQLDYDQIVSNLFEHKKQGFTNTISLKKKLDKSILSDSHIKNIHNRLREIAKQQIQKIEDLKNTILNSQMAQLFFDCISGKTGSIVVEGILSYFRWLKSIQEEFDNKLTSKSYNLLCYIKQQKKNITNLQDSIQKDMSEVEPLTKISKQTSNSLKLAVEISGLLQKISKWMIDKGFSKRTSIFSVKDDQNVWTFGLQFSEVSPFQYIKNFFNKYLIEKSSPDRTELQAVFIQFFKKYIESKVIVKEAGNATEVSLQISKVPQQLTKEIREDLVQIEEMLTFTRLYNQHRFNLNSPILKKLEEAHSKLINKMKAKLYLVHLKSSIENCKWNGLEKFSIFKDLFECFNSELVFKKDNLQSLIEMTESISVKQTSLNAYIEWFKRCGVTELKMQYYLLKSSRRDTIAIFPVAKIEKDKSKASEQIKRCLADIKLPPNFSVSVQNEISVIRLQKEVFKCQLRDNEHYLTQETQLSGFQPELPQGQILLMSFYQGSDNQKATLYLGDLSLQQQCILNIKEYETSSTVTCSICKIAREDYDEWKKSNLNPDEQSYKILKKKIRGLATAEQKIQNVCVGQEVCFNDTGAWLRQELKKHRKRVEDLQKAKQEKKRQQMIAIAESQKFLSTVYQEMLKQSLPAINVSLDKVKQFQREETPNPTGEIKGYWKKILDSTKKVIQKIQESKSSEEMNRISTITKDYLKMLKIKLLSNQVLQEQVLENALSSFGTIQQKRQIELEKKRIQKQTQNKLKQESRQSALKKRLAQDASKLMHANTHSNSLNVANALNTPELEVKPQFVSAVNAALVEDQSQEAQPKAEQIDECQLILECRQFQKVKKGKEQQLYMSYLIYLLQSQSRKDIEYYRCILQSFWNQPLNNRESLVILI